jgi:hypothetical protein
MVCAASLTGTDHHGNNSCTPGAYWCTCGWGADTQCNTSVGRWNLTEIMSSRKCEPDRHGDPPPTYECCE